MRELKSEIVQKEKELESLKNKFSVQYDVIDTNRRKLDIEKSAYEDGFIFIDHPPFHLDKNNVIRLIKQLTELINE